MSSSSSSHPHLLRDEVADIDPFTGRVLGGRFALVSRQPGVRRSYLAYDALDSRIVEVIVGGQDELARFRSLVQASAAVDHPRIVSYIAWGVHSAGASGIVAYVACEFIPGAVTLDEYRVQRGPLDGDEIAEIIECLTEALKACRSRGVTLASLTLRDIVITSLPGWPRVAKLRAVPAPVASQSALCREEVRELELPVDEDLAPTPGARDDHHARLAEIAQRLS